MLEDLKKEVYDANMRLKADGLVVLTWGNASAIDRETGLVVVKPSGVGYDSLSPEKMAVVDLDGNMVEGLFRPSSDTPTHVALYRAFAGIGGIVHTHSPEATAWAQAAREIPCYGTTHADCFHGAVPVTRFLTAEEVEDGYERHTGDVIAELFAGKDPMERPGVLVAGHAPFTWGANAMKAVENAVSLEQIAKMARLTEEIRSGVPAPEIPSWISEKHYSRKHGPNAYYGQISR